MSTVAIHICLSVAGEWQSQTMCKTLQSLKESKATFEFEYRHSYCRADRNARNRLP